jgi:hypothetical protein
MKTACRVLWGFSLLFMGVVLMFLPGPGLTTFISGLAVLARHFLWARQAIRGIHKYLLKVANLLEHHGR